MSLLVDIATDALDPAYAEAAAARAPERAPSGRRGSLTPVVLVALLAALLVTAAVVQARAEAPSAARARAALERDVRAQTKETERLEQQVARLRAQAARAQDSALAATSEGAALRRRLDALERSVGTAPLSGPGLRVRLDDAPAPKQDPLAGESASPGTSRVLDRDVQDVVNALWAAGAEGIAVNGVRLTAETAIRSAGQAILVDFQPLTAPYDVVAVGPSEQLETSYAASDAAARLRTYAQVYGLRHSYRTLSKVELPAASGVALRLAQPVQAEPSPSPTPAPQEETP